jgi:small subunit ribosomal protein S1
VDSVDVERERIALNRKAVLPDPWQVFTDRYKMGDLVDGVVTNVVDYGIFVAAPGGAQGLVHTSRMTRLGISTPRDMFKEGDGVLVRVINIDLDRRHIELSVDDVTTTEQEAWMFQRRETERLKEEVNPEDVPPASDAEEMSVDA